MMVNDRGFHNLSLELSPVLHLWVERGPAVGRTGGSAMGGSAAQLNSSLCDQEL